VSTPRLRFKQDFKPLFVISTPNPSHSTLTHTYVTRHKRSARFPASEAKLQGDEMGMWDGRSNSAGQNHSRPRDCNAQSALCDATGKLGRQQSMFDA